MPNPLEVCTVSIGGSIYRDWTSVAVTREFGTAVSRATLKIVEGQVSKLGSWGSMRVSIGDLGSVALGGIQVINGVVEVRQAVLQPAMSGVQVDIVSRTYAAVQASAPTRPGEFKKYNFQQIARSLLGEVGVGLNVLGSIAEIAKPFPLFRIIPGERIFDALERLAKFRNVFFTDDAEGNLVVGRGGTGSAPTLAEGVNIKSAQLVMSNPWLAQKIFVDGPRPGNDQKFGDLARTVSATAQLAGSKIPGVYRVAAELAGDADDMKLRADHEVAGAVATTIECAVVVQGWFAPSGKLWIAHVGDDVAVVSNTLFPTGSQNLKIKSVTHTQDAGQAGTETQIVCCHPGGLGVGPDTGGVGGGPGAFGASPATPNGGTE